MPKSRPLRSPTVRVALALALLALPGCPGPDVTPADAPGLDSGPPPDVGPLPDTGPLPDGSRPDAPNPIDLSCLNMIPLRLWTTDPSAVAMLYRIETCAGETVIFDPGPGESVFDYYSLTENGSSLSSEAVPDIDLSGAQRAYVTLLLDFSSSTRAVEADLLASARAFVDALLGASSRVWVGIEIFDGRPDPVIIQRPTPDLAELRAAIAGLATYSDPLADEGSTNLNGAIAASVADLQAWQDSVMMRNDLGVVTSGYLVAFTDGRDTSGLVTTATAASSVDAARVATGSSGALANVQTYAVALESSDFTAAARADLVTILGGDESATGCRTPPPPGSTACNRYLYEGDLATLSAEFADLAARIAEQAEATHLLKYCSAARAGSRDVELDVLPSVGTTRNTIVFTFSADGFAPGCAAFIDTICVDRECGGFNCGGCDDRTHACDAASGQCVSECVLANACSGETIPTGLGYALTCDATALGASVMQCGGVCIDTASDPDHCGSCTEVCETLAGAGERCVAGVCTCPGGGEVCGGSCRAPSFFDTDNANCGTCGNVCGGGASCVAGTCECPGSDIFCDAACRAASYFTSSTDCGTCNNVCPVRATCSAGACACPSGEIACAGSCRPPSYFETSATDCGSCGNACALPFGCDAGTCTEVAQLDVGRMFTLARLTDGRVMRWGGDSLRGGGPHPIGSVASTPVEVVPAVGATLVAAGSDHACFLAADGVLRCWGRNSEGQVGDGTTTARNLPVAVSGLTGVSALALGAGHSCALLSDRTVRCWGINANGEVGDGTTLPRLTPVAVTGLSDVVELVAGNQRNCARTGAGRILCWGSDPAGGVAITAPLEVPGLAGVVELAVASNHTCARLSDGTVSCWGDNSVSQLGDGTTSYRGAPVPVVGLPGPVSAIAAGTGASCATVVADGSVWCWGMARSAGLRPVGTGIIGPTRSRVSMPALELTGYWEHMCARLASGAVECWGLNTNGQLGNGRVADTRWAFESPSTVAW